MALTGIALISGITGLLIVLTTLIIFSYIISVYLQKRQTQTLVLALMILSMGAPWFGVSTNFILDFLGQGFLDDKAYMMLASFWIWAAPTATYVTTSFLRPELKNKLSAFFLLLSLIFFAIIYILMPLDIIPIEDIFGSTPAEEGGMPDAEFKSYVRYYLIVCIGTIVICGIFFIITALRTEIPVVKARGLLLGSGAILFGFAGFLDGGVDITSELLLLIVRLLLVVALITIFLAVTLPGFIFKRFGVVKSATS